MRRPAAMEPQEPLRPDPVEGWPAPEEQTAWYGAPATELRLLDAYRGGGMHHAWLIGGPKGIGKATLAYRFARFVLANPEPAAIDPAVADLSLPDDLPAVRRVAGRGHPGLLVLERPWDERNKRFRNELTVPEIRRTVPFFGTTAGEGSWRIAIVDAADEMNHNAANALLKILEEPPPRSLFLIVAHAPGRLLPTIRSRCRRLDVATLPVERIAEALRDHADDDDAGDDRIALAAALAEGSLRRAILFIAGDGARQYRDFSALVAGLPSLDVERMHALADGAAARGRDDAWTAFTEMVAGWLNRRVRGTAEPAGNGAVPVALQAVPLARWAEVWDNLRRSVADTEIYNLDRKRTALAIMLSLARVTRM